MNPRLSVKVEALRLKMRSSGSLCDLFLQRHIGSNRRQFFVIVGTCCAFFGYACCEITSNINSCAYVRDITKKIFLMKALKTFLGETDSKLVK